MQRLREAWSRWDGVAPGLVMTKDYGSVLTDLAGTPDNIDVRLLEMAAGIVPSSSSGAVGPPPRGPEGFGGRGVLFWPHPGG